MLENDLVEVAFGLSSDKIAELEDDGFDASDLKARRKEDVWEDMLAELKEILPTSENNAFYLMMDIGNNMEWLFMGTLVPFCSFLSAIDNDDYFNKINNTLKQIQRPRKIKEILS